MSGNNSSNWSGLLIIGGLIGFVYYGLKALVQLIVAIVSILTDMGERFNTRNMADTGKIDRPESKSDSTKDETITITITVD
jgi:hypothetical protein